MRNTLFFKWHSFLGLAVGTFVLIAALTGSIIAFYHELDAKVNSWQVTPKSTLPLSDPLSHIEAVEKSVEGSRVSWVSLSLSHESSWHYFLAPKTLTKPLLNNELYVNPYSGEIKGMRLWGEITQGMSNLLPFIYKLHYSLSLGSIGILVMGLASLAWLVLLICGLYLTLPTIRKGFMKQWIKSWKLRFSGSVYAKSYSWHKAIGLWSLPLLILMAWSSVSLNLHEFHERLFGSFMAMQKSDEHIKPLKIPRTKPKLHWIEAREMGRNAIQTIARTESFVVKEESWMMYNPLKGVYLYAVKSSLDISQEHGETTLYIDGNSGVVKGYFIPTHKANGDTLTQWLEGLHKGSIFGLTHKIVLCLLGILSALFVLSGVYLWWKRGAQRKL